MFKRLEIKKFRCFNHLMMENIAPITLIGGRNNSGKSAILEAIFLAVGYRNPNIFFALAIGRNGNGNLSTTVQKIWNPLFYNFNETDSFNLILERDSGVVSDLMVIKVPDDKIGLNVNSNAISSILKKGYRPSRINSYFYSLKYTFTMNGEKNEGTFSLQDGKISYISADKASSNNYPMVKVILYKATYTADNATIAEWVSQFILEQKKDLLVNILKDFDEKISDITTVIEDGIPYVYVILNNGQNMPITYMGDGINKLLQLLLCIFTSPQGVVLIDELENGFHYSLYSKILETLYKAAFQVDCQLFITTHNIDILSTSAEVMKNLGKLDKLCYQRMDFSDGKRNAYAFSGEDLENALNAEMEVR